MHGVTQTSNSFLHLNFLLRSMRKLRRGLKEDILLAVCCHNFSLPLRNREANRRTVFCFVFTGLLFVTFFFNPMPHMSFTDFVVFPPAHGRSVTDF